MSHNVETFVYAGQPAWHGLGHQILDDLTPEQVLKEAKLDWNVYKSPMYAEVNGEKVSVGRQVLVRDSDHRILSVVSDDWEPTQNSEAFNFFHDFVMAGGMKMETAGSLRMGEVVFGLAKINDGFELSKGDNVESYLLFTNPHQYGASIDVRHTTVRVVCNNTLTLALSDNSMQWFKASHRKKFDPEAAKEALGITHTQMDDYKTAATFLGSKRYTTPSVEQFFNKIFPISSTKDAFKVSKNAKLAMEVLETQPGHEFNPGSWWQAFNAVTFMTDHMLGKTQDNRVVSSLYGTNRTLKIGALKTAIEFAEAA